MRYLPKEMPIRRHQHHQLAHQPRDASVTPLQRQQLQTPPTATAETGSSFGIGRNERYWKEYGVEDFGWQVEAKLGTL
jgi:hypothetical protein